MVEYEFSKLGTRVRFSSPAQICERIGAPFIKKLEFILSKITENC